MRIAIAVGVALLLAGCSSDGSDGGASAGPTTVAATTTTAVPTFAVDGEHEVDPNFRQGLARSDDGWVFVTNQTLYRTDADFAKVEEQPDAIPAELAVQGYDHMGDGDVAAVDGLLWVPVERPDKDSGVQVTARFDPDTFDYVDSFEVAQHHNAFVTVDGDGVAYSADEFSDDTIVRYRVVDGTVEQLEPLRMSASIDRIQGGDVAGGALWLSTDDDHNGVYRVDLVTGEVTDVGSAGRVAGEGEGIDAEDGAPATLRVLVADEDFVPMWVVELRPQP
ncbi:MAG: hypothetical protein KF906_08080 [Actinobacteria bacterium]|nr:hypothetical protein [Actinomycetota bacterium]